MLVQDAANSQSDLHSLRDALDRSSANLSMDALLILDLINVHAFDCFDPAAFDYAAVARLCTRAMIRIPNEWSPLMERVLELALTSLQMFPQYSAVDFKNGCKFLYKQ